MKPKLKMWVSTIRNRVFPINKQQNCNPLSNTLISTCSPEQDSLGYLQTHLKENASSHEMV